MKKDTPQHLLAFLDDDRSFRVALLDLLEAEGMSARRFESAEQFLESDARDTAMCLISDVRMPKMSGLELQSRLNAEPYKLPIIFATGRGDIPTTVRAMKAGAIDFFTKPIQRESLLAAIERDLDRGRNSRESARDQMDLVARYNSLTRREQEILPLLVNGLLNKQVAGELGITEYTVQIHRGNIMRKMKADSFAGLVQTSERLGSSRNM